MVDVSQQSESRIDQTISFGPFCLQPGQHVLLEGDKPVQLGARALDILISLTGRSGKLVTKNELVATAWPNVIVEESNLRAQVASLRKALRDGRDGARYIVTVPGRGYRFVAPTSYSDPRGMPTPVADRGSNVPVCLMRPIGRDNAISAVSGRFHRYRLTTIVGTGGIGKTTVCLAVAEELAGSFEDGVCFLDLAPLRDPQLVSSVLACALGLANVSEEPLSDVVAFLRQRQMLLVFDSCEQVIEAVAILAETLLKETPGTRILATSREALRAEGESVYRLLPLETPPVSAGLTAAEALTFSAVQLFVERAASSGDVFELDDSDAPVVADICRQLDGIALAIELAAGRLDAFGTRGIAQRLDDRFRLLTGGRRTALPRHRTLVATLDWSYDSLSATEQRLLRHLAVFSEEFTFDSASAVVTDVEQPDADVSCTLANLIAKSLVVANTNGTVARYRLLDTTRAYALAKLYEIEEFDSVVRRLAAYLCSILDHALSELEDVSGPEWLSRYGGHINNIQMALDWARSPRGDPAVCTSLTVAAIPLWFQLSLVDECRDRVQRALECIASETIRDAQARNVMQLYRALGLSRVFTIGLAPQASAAWAKALKIAEDLDDTEDQLEALWGLWFCQSGAGEYRAALRTAQRFRDIAESTADQCIGERLIGFPLLCMGDLTDARRHIDRKPASAAVLAPGPVSANRSRFCQAVGSSALLAKTLWLQGFPDQAAYAAQSGVEKAQSTSHAISLCEALARGACPVSLLTGDLATAEWSVKILLDHAAKHALVPWIVFGRCWQGALFIKQGDFAGGLRLLANALDELQECRLFAHYVTGFFCFLAEGFAGAGRIPEGRAAIDQGLQRCEEKEELWCIAELLRLKGELFLQTDGADTVVAEEHFLQSIEWARRQGALSWELRAATSLARLQRDRKHVRQAHDSLAEVYRRFSDGFRTADLQIASSLLNELS